jgi:hypothetical protein
MFMELFWIVSACACMVVGIYFFFVRPRAEETPPSQQETAR